MHKSESHVHQVGDHSLWLFCVHPDHPDKQIMFDRVAGIQPLSICHNIDSTVFRIAQANQLFAGLKLFGLQLFSQLFAYYAFHHRYHDTTHLGVMQRDRYVILQSE